MTKERQSYLLFLLVLSFSFACGGSEAGYQCGAGTVAVDGLCIVEDAEHVRPSTDMGAYDAADLAKADEPDVSGYDTRSDDPDAGTRDIDRSIPVGSACDPNFFEPYCDGSSSTTCDNGYVARTDACTNGEDCRMVCPVGTSCNPIYRNAYCLPEGLTNEPCEVTEFRSSCSGDVFEGCDPRIYRIVRRDCAAENLACVADRPVSRPCVDPDAVDCRSEGWEPSCLSAQIVERCTGDGTVDDTECDQGTSCETTPAGDRCVPTGATLCDPATFQVECDGSTTAVNCLGYVYREDCPGITVCRLATMLRFDDGPKAVCVLPEAVECNPEDYVSWCRDNVWVSCDDYTGHTNEQDCQDGSCVEDGNFTRCEY